MSEAIDLADNDAGTIERLGAPCLPALDLIQLAKVRAQPKAFAISNLAPRGEVTLFTGPGSAGKSLLAQQMATAAAAGVGTLGYDLDPAPAIYLTCEDDPGQLHWRQQHICEALGVNLADLNGRLSLISRRGELDNELSASIESEDARPSPLYRRLEATIGEIGARHVWLDNVAHLFPGNENDRGEVTQFVNLLNRLAGRTGAAIVLLGHPNKSGDNYSGSTAWLNAVRSQFTIEHDEETDVRTLRSAKANYARKGVASRFVWIDWAFVLEDDLAPDRAAALRATAQAANDNERFLTCLAEMTRQKRSVSESPNALNFAAKVFATMPEAKGVGKERMGRAMDRLFRLGRIERAELWQGPDRKPVFGLRDTENGGAEGA